MPSISNLMELGIIGTEVQQITGKPSDALKASGVSAWIQSATGDSAIVVRLPNNRARLVWKDTTPAKMEKWFDELTAKKDSAPTLEMELKPILMPYVLKKAVPVTVGIFAIGLVAGWLAGKL